MRVRRVCGRRRREGGTEASASGESGRPARTGHKQRRQACGAARERCGASQNEAGERARVAAGSDKDSLPEPLSAWVWRRRPTGAWSAQTTRPESAGRRAPGRAPAGCRGGRRRAENPPWHGGFLWWAAGASCGGRGSCGAAVAMGYRGWRRRARPSPTAPLAAPRWGCPATSSIKRGAWIPRRCGRGAEGGRSRGKAARPRPEGRFSTRLFLSLFS